MMLKTCALVALIAFAQIVRAQDDDGMDLESRYGGGYKNKGNKGYLSKGRNRGNNNYEEEEGRGGKGNRGGSRGLEYEGGGRGRGGNGNNIEGFEVDIANQVETNKVVPGIVEVAPTVVTNSNSAQVYSSSRKRNFKQNSESKVVQNNVVKSTDIHVHTNRKVKLPKTINTYVRKHHTQYIINTQPVKTNINIERQQEIIKPAVENVVIYQNTESLSRHRRPTIVRNRQQHQRLPTIREQTRNEGTQVIGNPTNAGSASIRGEGKGLRLGGNRLNGNRLNNGEGNLRRGGKGKNYNRGNNEENNEYQG